MFTLSRTTARLLVIVPLAALLAGACEHNDPFRENAPVAGELLTIVVTPNPGSAVVGGTIQYTAAGQDVNGAVVALGPVVWSRLNATAGTINSGTGLFTAGTTPGTYANTIRATSGGLSGFATAIVTAFVPVAPLGAAETHGILAGSAVTCVAGNIVADVSVWPGTAVSGFPPCTHTGADHLGDAFAQTAQGALTTAFLGLEGLACNTTISANLGGTTLTPGVHCSTSSVGATGVVTLNGQGNPNAEFVIRAGSTLTTAGSVVLTNGAQAKNVYWWVGSSATLGTSSAWQGNILALSSITMEGSGTLCGRALARNGAVSLAGPFNTIKLPPVAAATCTFP